MMACRSSFRSWRGWHWLVTGCKPLKISWLEFLLFFSLCLWVSWSILSDQAYRAFLSWLAGYFPVVFQFPLGVWVVSLGFFFGNCFKEAKQHWQLRDNHKNWPHQKRPKEVREALCSFLAFAACSDSRRHNSKPTAHGTRQRRNYPRAPRRQNRRKLPYGLACLSRLQEKHSKGKHPQDSGWSLSCSSLLRSSPSDPRESSLFLPEWSWGSRLWSGDNWPVVLSAGLISPIWTKRNWV